MSLVMRGNLAKTLLPGVKGWFGHEYNMRPKEFMQLFDEETSKRAYEEYVSLVGLGLMEVKSEGNPTSFDQIRQGFVSRLTVSTYSLACSISMEAVEDNQYKNEMKSKAEYLGRSANATLNTLGALVYDRAFDSSYTGGDSKELCATDHPNISGGTFQNELTTAADLSEAALEQAIIDIGNWTDDKGLPIAAMAKRLIVPTELEFDAMRIMQSDKTVGSALNDANVVRGKIGDVHVNHFLSDTDAWFLRTDVKGMKYINRKAPVVTTDNDWSTDNAHFKVALRAVFGWSDPKALFGSPGA